MHLDNSKPLEFFKKISLSKEAASEIKSLLINENEGVDINQKLNRHFEQIAKDITQNFNALIVEIIPQDQELLSYQEIYRLTVKIGEFLGELIPQNEQGDKVIHVYDRNRLGSMFSGSRYHQTREGGSIHTDNVNVPEVWDFLLFSCISPALVGGENIIVDGIKIHKILKKSFPDALAILEENFTWEMRGFSETLYYAPIITYDQSGLPHFRHLRPYMESAHNKASQPLSEKQLYAVDVLDALTNSSENQLRYKMKKGDILLTRDTQVFHGRTCFSDAEEAVSFPDYLEGRGPTLKRTMERLWIKKHQ